MIGGELTQILLANEDLQSIVDGRIKPVHGTQLDTFPAIRYIVDELQPNLCVDGGIGNYSIKFLTIGKTYSEVQTIVSLVKDTLDRYTNESIIWCHQETSLDIEETISDLDKISLFSTEQQFTVKTILE